MAIPLGTAQFSKISTKNIIYMSTEVFKIALQIGGPVLVALFLTSFVMGIIARTVPQMNIFIVGFPLKIGAGLAMMGVTLPMFVYVFGKLVDQFETSVIRIIQAMG